MLLEIKEGSFEWALAHLRAGKKVTRKSWTTGYIYLWCRENNKLKFDNGASLGFDVQDCFTFFDWELYQEPKLTFKDLKGGDRFTIVKVKWYDQAGIIYTKLHKKYRIPANQLGHECKSIFNATFVYDSDESGETQLVAIDDNSEVKLI